MILIWRREALQDAFSAALLKWPQDGLPKNPCSWLISAGKFKAIDSIRRVGRGEELVSEKFAAESEDDPRELDKHLIEDDQLRLIFYCCHPLLPLDSRIALSLREVCGMKTEEIARAYLVSFETIKKRISRARALIKEKNIPYEIPSQKGLNERMNAVLHVVYLIFNEGYSASSGVEHIRKELTAEAMFLGRELTNLISTPESLGLLALLLIQESRRETRVTAQGDLVALENQDRRLWDQELIREGRATNYPGHHVGSRGSLYAAGGHRFSSRRRRFGSKYAVGFNHRLLRFAAFYKSFSGCGTEQGHCSRDASGTGGRS